MESGVASKREIGSNHVLNDRSLNSRARIEQILLHSSGKGALRGEEEAWVTKACLSKSYKQVINKKKMIKINIVFYDYKFN
jgi:hypothetical protein